MKRKKKQKKTKKYKRRSLYGKRLDEFRTKLILKYLRRGKYSETRTAKLLGIHRNTLLYEIAKLKINKRKLKKEFKEELKIKESLKKSKAKKREVKGISPPWAP